MTGTVVTSRIHYVAIALFALVGVVLQIILTRVFSVTNEYHFAFACVTFAMLGLTAGALRVYANPNRFNHASTNQEIAYHACLCSVFVMLGIMLFADIPGRIASRDFFEHRYGTSLFEIHLESFEAAKLAVLAGLILIIFAFVANGVCITLLLTRFSRQIGKLYAADLIGAASGCALIVVAMRYLDPISNLFLVTTASVWVAWLLLFILNEHSHRRYLFYALACSLLSVVQIISVIQQQPFIKVRWDKSKILGTERVLFERWNSYSHVTVNPMGTNPHGWAMGNMSRPYRNQQLYMQIDAGAATVINRFDGSLLKVGYLRYDMVNLAYHLRPIDNVAVIGVGGGRDLLAALVFGAKHVTGIEMNPAVIEATTERFGNFAGNLHERPDVTIVNAEGRSFLNSADKQYDLIQIPAIDTWAALASGGLTLTENKLYTVEAWAEFISHLTPDGILSVNHGIRFYNIAKAYRMLAIATEAVAKAMPGANPADHILMTNLRGSFTVLISKSPFSANDIANLDRTNQEIGYREVVTPGREVKQEIFAAILNRKADQAFYDRYSADFSPTTDNRPYFFNHERFGDLFLGREYPEAYTLKGFGYGGPKLLIYCLIAASIMAIGLIGWPLVKIYRQSQTRTAMPAASALYFAGIGLGFMFIEMSQMQHLMIFLGHPVYGLVIVLFTMLLFGGIGSFTVRSELMKRPSSILMRPIILIALLIITSFATSLVTDAVRDQSTVIRIIASIGLLIPISFFMGMMFPLGIGLNDSKQELLPWFWAINGVMSVIATILAVMISMAYGIAFTYWLGIGCYVICLLCVVSLLRQRNKAVEVAA